MGHSVQYNGVGAGLLCVAFEGVAGAGGTERPGSLEVTLLEPGAVDDGVGPVRERSEDLRRLVSSGWD